MSDPTADCQALIGSVLPLAEELLTAQRGFLPFGGAMRPDGQLVSIASYDGNERRESTDVIAFLRRHSSLPLETANTRPLRSSMTCESNCPRVKKNPTP